MEQKLKQVVDFLASELATLRTGRANPALLTGLSVDSYGAKTPLKQVAQVSVPNATTIVVAPWDKSLLPAVDKAIQESDLGLTPVNDGTVIRLSLPPMTEERRIEMTKVVGEKLEAARVSVRNIRHEAIEEAERADLPEDQLKRQKDDLTKLANEYTGKLEVLAKEKEQEIMKL